MYIYCKKRKRKNTTTTTTKRILIRCFSSFFLLLFTRSHLNTQEHIHIHPLVLVIFIGCFLFGVKF